MSKYCHAGFANCQDLEFLLFYFPPLWSIHLPFPPTAQEKKKKGKKNPAVRRPDGKRTTPVGFPASAVLCRSRGLQTLACDSDAHSEFNSKMVLIAAHLHAKSFSHLHRYPSRCWLSLFCCLSTNCNKHSPFPLLHPHPHPHPPINKNLRKSSPCWHNAIWKMLR